MRTFRAVAIIALLSAPAFASPPAFAQDRMQQAGEKDPEKTRQQIEADKEAQKAYKRSLSNIPDQAVSDPWGNVRSDNAPKAAAKAPAKRAKTDAAAH
jgi:poly(3-hydroxybutyrate) depolymerase